MFHSSEYDQNINLPIELLIKIFSSLDLIDLEQLAPLLSLNLTPVLNDLIQNKHNELKNKANGLLESNNTKNISHFLATARKQNQQWLLDYCYQEAKNCYFSEGKLKTNENRSPNQLDWAIKCLQPEKELRALFNKESQANEYYILTHKLSLALKSGNAPAINLFTEETNIIAALEWLIRMKKAIPLKQILSHCVQQQKLPLDDFASLLKLSLINKNATAAKMLLKEVSGLFELVKERGEELFSKMPHYLLINAKLLNYWQEKNQKTFNLKHQHSKVISFFNIPKYEEDKRKLQVADKLIKKFIENEDDVVLSKQELHLIKKSKKLNEIYNARVELSDNHGIDERSQNFNIE